jgi:hypothetical protein
MRIDEFCRRGYEVLASLLIRLSRPERAWLAAE